MSKGWLVMRSVRGQGKIIDGIDNQNVRDSTSVQEGSMTE